MPSLAGSGLEVAITAFLAATVVILTVGVRLTRFADRLADVSGLGEAMVGAAVLGAVTSLPGIVTSVTAAAEGHPELAVSNAVGGIAAQTLFLVIADVAYRKANLEHAAASVTNLLNGCLLVFMIALVLAAHSAPAVDFLAVHPATPVLVIVYVAGLSMVSKSREKPTWGPQHTADTRQDTPEEPRGDGRSVTMLALMVAALGAVVAGAGYVVALSSLVIAAETGLSEGVVGALFAAVATSTPELVTTVAAVRRGALTLAVGGIVGGNSFDVLFIAFADIAYRDGSIYNAIGGEQVFTLLLAVLMTSVLLLGLIRRERHGFANVGFESVVMVVLYFGGMLVVATGF